MPTLIVNNLFKNNNQLQDLKTQNNNILKNLELKLKRDIFLLEPHENALKLKINLNQPNSLIIELKGFDEVYNDQITRLKEVLGLSEYTIKNECMNEMILIFYDESNTGATNHEK